LKQFKLTKNKEHTNNDGAPQVTKVKLVRDAIGGIRLTTEHGEILQNVFVKDYEHVEGSVTKLNLEVIFISPYLKGSNW